MDIKQLFELAYWINPNPGIMSVGTTLFIGSLFVLCLVLKFFGRMIYFQNRKNLAKPEKKLLFMTESLLLTMGSLGLVWLFFAYQTVPYVSTRFIFLIWVVGFFVWAYIIAQYAFTEFPKAMQSIKERERLEKYLPRKDK